MTEKASTGYADQARKKDIDFEKIILSEKKTILGNKAYEEFTNNIYNEGTKKSITVRWFNTLINHEFNCVFSIGLPLTKEPTIDEDIDSLRAYFRDILEQDKTVINAMKEITMKYSAKIFSDEAQRQKEKKGTC